MEWLVYFIVGMSIFNLIRMMLYLVGSDIYAITRSRADGRSRQRTHAYRPTVSLVVPAHNEASVIEKTLECLVQLDYPANKLQIIVADDGSTDDTVKVVRRFMRRYKGQYKLNLFRQPNGGKADALNNAIQQRATGKLVMCIDADSLIAPDGLKKAVEYFRKRDVVALASNVNILEGGTIIGLAQRFEYLISYHMKKAQTLYNIEYIIGGIGSMFRRSILDKVGYYDTNTMTEDIDLTMKIIAKGNKRYRVVYAPDCITYTESVQSFKSLVNQRFRWKYGRMQTFLKNYKLFFSSDSKYSKPLTWFVLPFAIFQELVFLLEPLIVTFILVISIRYRDPFTLLSALTVVSAYILVNVWSTVHLSVKERIRLSLLAPSMYGVLYILSLVEYAALIRALRQLPRLKSSISGERTTWVSPERNGLAQKSA